MTAASICPVCGGKELTVAGRVAGQSVLRCRGCRLELTASALMNSSKSQESADQGSSTVTSAEYREAMITRYDSLRDSIRRLAVSRLELYSEHLGRKPANILEVGSGTGWMIKAFQELGVQTAGLENDAALVSLARENGANVRLADICRIYPGGFSKFDVVYSSQTLEHILFPRTAIMNMKELARPGGLIHLDVPNSAGWGARLRRLRRGEERWGMLEPPHHQIGYYPVTLRKLLENADLEIVRITERPTNDSVFGQAILPTGFMSRTAMSLSRWLGHGYLLVGLARVPVSRET